MKCKKNGIIPKGLKSSFLLSISNFLQSERRLCERFQTKLLNRILSDKYWLMEKFQRKCDSLQDDLKSYNLGSRFYEQNDNMLNKKRNKRKRFGNCRLSPKFAKLKNQTWPTTNIAKRDEVRIKEAKNLCDRTSVYNLSGEQIPKETEELIRRLGFNFQFTERKFPTLEIITSSELCCQKIEKF